MTIDSGVFYIAFFAKIDAKSTEDLMDAVFNKVPNGIKTLYILMNTGGGSVSHGIAIYNLLRAAPYKIVMHNIGNMDSIGNTIFMAGDERYAIEHAVFLLHSVKTGIDSKMVEMTALTEKQSCIETDETRIRNIITKYTSITPEEMNAFFIEAKVQETPYALAKGMIHDVRDVKLPEDAQVLVIKAS